MAPAIGRSQNYVAERLRDEKPFTLDDVDKICQFYGLDPAEFITKAYREHFDDAISLTFSSQEPTTQSDVTLAARDMEDDVTPMRNQSKRPG